MSHSLIRAQKCGVGDYRVFSTWLVHLRSRVLALAECCCCDVEESQRRVNHFERFQTYLGCVGPVPCLGVLEYGSQFLDQVGSCRSEVLEVLSPAETYNNSPMSDLKFSRILQINTLFLPHLLGYPKQIYICRRCPTSFSVFLIRRCSQIPGF